LLTESFVRYQLVQTSHSRVPFSHWWYRRRFPSTQESNCQRAYSLSLPVKRAGNLFSYQIWWYLVVVVVVVEIACQFMISLVIHSRGFHVTLTFFPWSIASKFLCLTDGRLVHSRGNDFQVKLRDWRVIELWLSCRNARPEENGIWS
jgi:hypothetical protein